MCGPIRRGTGSPRKSDFPGQSLCDALKGVRVYRRRRQRNWCKNLCRVPNMVVAVLSVGWLGTHDWAAEPRPATQAALAGGPERHRVPALFSEVLLWSGFAGKNEWEDTRHAPSSSQRVSWNHEWSDPELRIVALEPSNAETTQGATKKPASDTTVGLTERDGAALGSRRASERTPAPETGDLKPSRQKPSGRKRVNIKGNLSRYEWFTVTAYCPCRRCCGRWARYHKTASGLPITYNRGDLVAADTRVLPFHTRVGIPGYGGGRLVPVVDRGSAVKGRMIDVFFPNHYRAKRWGKKWLLVEIVK